MIRKPSDDLEAFMNMYPTHVQNKALELRKIMLGEAPNSFELIYDSYNALSIAFSFTSELKNAFCHIALYSKHVNLGFNNGSELADINNRLIGSGKHIRHLKMEKPADLKAPYLRKFIKKAIYHNKQKFPAIEESTNAKAIVKSVSENKRRPN